MIAVAATLACLVAWCWVPPGVRPYRWGSEATGAVAPRRRRWVIPVTGVVVSVLVAGGAVGGHRGLLIAGVACLAGGTFAAITVHRWRQRRVRRTRAAIGQACAALASLVAAGRVPADALREVAADWDVLAEAAETVQLGGDPVEAWLRASVNPGCGGLAELARGWSVSVVTGAPLVALLDAVATSLMTDADIRHTVEAELASSRATGRLLAGLPLIGLLLGFGFGGNPVAFLLDQPVGWGCSLAGTALACGGVWWNERIADKAEAW